MRKWSDYKICSVHYTPSILFTIWNCSLPSLMSLLSAHKQTTYFVWFSCFIHSILTVLILSCFFMALQGPGQWKEGNSGKRNHKNYTSVKAVSCVRDRSLLYTCISHGNHLDLEDSNSLGMSLLKV